MVQQKNIYISGLLAIILLANPSNCRAASFLKTQDAYNYVTDKAKSVGPYLQYVTDKAKSVGPYLPGVLLTGLAANNLMTGGFSSNLPIARPLLAGTVATMLGRAYGASKEKDGGYYLNNKEGNDGYKSYLKNTFPYALPFVATGLGAAITGQNLGDAATVSAFTAVPTFMLSKGRQAYHSYQFGQIKDQITKIVNNTLAIKDENNSNYYLFNNNDLLKLILDYNAYFPYVNVFSEYGESAAQLKDARDFIKQIVLEYKNNHNIDENQINKQICPLTITQENKNFFNATKSIQKTSELNQ